MKKGMVYKIELENEIYVGSTEQKLCVRQSNHNASLRLYPDRKLYKKCIEQGIDKIKCIWVADIEFNSTAEKRMKEEEYRKKMNGTLNSQRCYTTIEEYKQDKKELYEIHKEQILEKSKEYYINNKEHILDQTKEYRETHREKNKEYAKEYYEKNKDIVNAKKKEKIECPICKSMISRCVLSRHQKTKKCMEYK